MRNAGLTAHAKAMRRQPTPAEQQLWFALRAKRFESTKFRRQKVIGPYIADFASRDPMLVIEIDGDSHGQQQQYDAARTRYLENEGYRVIRFTNHDVLTNLTGVLEMIGGLVTKTPLPTLSPEGERAVKGIPHSLSPSGERRVNSAPRCSVHASDMDDPTLVGERGTS